MKPPCDIALYDGAPEDSEALRVLITVCGLDGGQPAQPARFLALPTARIWLARRAQRMLGFVATFESHTLAGHRLEVDLLGVHPEDRGQGIGAALVQRAIENWDGVARALIRVGNIASERVFASAGFAPEATVRELLVLTPPSEPAGSHDGASRHAERSEASHVPSSETLRCAQSDTACHAEHSEASRAPASETLRCAQGDNAPAGFFELLPVTTLTYCGAWVEAAAAERNSLRVWRALAAGAAAWAAERRLDMLGALPALAQRRCRRALAEAGYATEGHYRFFLRHGTDDTC